jgi:hypothetical protein
MTVETYKTKVFKLELTVSSSLLEMSKEELQEYLLSAFEAVSDNGRVHPNWELKSEEVVETPWHE